ncbi:MAG: glucose 1-dehydrogenase [Caldilineaceae bacterium]|nr:glucose 1-dehydrogenase [Caldilineaceae bacterium]
MSRQTDLAGKRALITGVDHGGIGQAIALELARQGAAIVCHYPFSDEGAAAAVARIQAEGGVASAVQGDFTQSASVCTEVVDTAAAFLGGLDVLVNNAGLTKTFPLAKVTPEHFDKLFAINVRSHIFCIQRALRYMRSAGGTVINLASVHAHAGASDYAVYAATKGAVAALTRHLAVELAPQKVRVNAIAPGLIEVPRYRETIPEYNPAVFAATVPWGRLGEPRDIGPLAAFLASDAAEFITGQTIYVDGGTTAQMSFVAHLEGQSLRAAD